LTVPQSDIDKAMDTETTLTFWTWVPNIQNEVKLFTTKYPKIKVNVVNVGQGAPHYQKLRTAIQAGQGAPDVAQVEFQFIMLQRPDLVAAAFDRTGRLARTCGRCRPARR
jgi:multiple sugar transport system substrate-binding protein